MEPTIHLLQELEKHIKLSMETDLRFKKCCRKRICSIGLFYRKVGKVTK
jgi:succinate dehydrogenase/fumarate reductase-like Fe-S protein